MIRGSVLALAGAFCLAAAPAAAASWLVLGSAIAVQTPSNPGGVPVLQGVPFHQQFMSFAFTIDDSVAGIDVASPGGVGEARLYPNAVTSFALSVGPWTIMQTPAARGALFAINDGAAGSGGRIDQLIYSETTAFVPGFQPAFMTDAPLPADAFVSGFVFGRSTVVQGGAPTLLGSAAIPPLDQLWINGPTFLSFDVRAGMPASQQALNALPLARFGASQLQFGVFRLDAPAVPEPATWAMMIAGFGLVGASLRRRRMAAA